MDKNSQWMDLWDEQRRGELKGMMSPITSMAYLTHLGWLRGQYRLVLKGTWTKDDCLEVALREDGDNAFNMVSGRPWKANLTMPLVDDRVVCLSIEP